MASSKQTYSPLSPKLMIQLAAPHTWAASLFPVFIATCLALATTSSHSVSIVTVVVLLAISILFQSAVNTINDYFDYIKGADTLENQSDPTDAVLVYNNVNPQEALRFALVLIGAAFALGIYCILIAGWIPLVIALIGALIVFLYSGGRTPISYLPIGELVSGITMGELITFASYYCLTKQAEPLVFVWALPVMLGIALIMMTNNGCDIEKDIEANRKTLPVLLGRKRTRTLYHGVIYTWLILVCVIVFVWFRNGCIVLPFMLLAVHPLGRALLGNPLLPKTRQAAFAQCISFNVAMGAFYGAAIICSITSLMLF